MTERISREPSAAEAPSKPPIETAAGANEACDLQHIETMRAGQPMPAVQSVGPGMMVYVPEYYEPNYAYPLIVWLEEEGCRAPAIAARMQSLSTRNYLSLTIAPSRPNRAGEEIPYAIGNGIAEVWERYSVNEDRIYVAGIGPSATAALQTLLLRHPEWLRGAICLGGEFPRTKHLLTNFRRLRGKRVLIGAGPTGEGSSIARSARLLHSAGLDVEVTQHTGSKMLREIDGWIMRGIATAI